MAVTQGMHGILGRQSSADCIVIGGGPAGLMAAIYLARFRRRVCVIDAGQSRAALIPRSHNLAGFAHGLSGSELIARMSEQVADLRVPIVKARVNALTRNDGLYRAGWDSGEALAPMVVLACGIVDVHPEFEGWRAAVDDGLLRYCPVCDAFEAIDKRIGVMGPLRSAAGKAIFLRGYSKAVTLLVTDEAEDGEKQSRLAAAGVKVLGARNPQVQRNGSTLQIVFDHNGTAEFDVLYPVMGSEVRSRLALSLDAAHNESGFLKVDERQRTSIPDLYGIGDMVSDLHQIAVAHGHAAVAACSIHGRLPRVLA
jgi:thioredoxin reductase (NADPH)